MAKIRAPTGTRLPETQRTIRVKGRFIIYLHKGQRVAASWTRGHKRPPTEAELEQQAEFTRMVQASKDIHPIMRESASLMAEGSKRTWRDYVSLAMTGKVAEFQNYGEIVSQYNLDILGQDPGMIVIRSEQWIALAIGTEAQVLTVVDGLPAWVDIPEVTYELTGDVTAGPGSGSQVATLAETGVIPDSYIAPNLVIDAKGRIIDAIDSGIVSGINQLTGDVTAGPGTGSQVAALAATGVVAATYTLPTLALDAKGRVLSATNGTIGTPNGAFHPGMVPGRLYIPAISGTLTNAGMVGNTLMAYPVYIPNACTVNTLRSQVNGAGVGTLMEYGIYTNNNGLPDQKVLDAGSINISPTGVRTISGLTQALAPGWYWITWAANGTVTMSVMSATTSSPAVAQGVQALAPAQGPYAFVTGAWTFSAGALPTTFPSPTPTTAAIPALAFTIT